MWEKISKKITNHMKDAQRYQLVAKSDKKFIGMITGIEHKKLSIETFKMQPIKITVSLKSSPDSITIIPSMFLRLFDIKEKK